MPRAARSEARRADRSTWTSAANFALRSAAVTDLTRSPYSMFGKLKTTMPTLYPGRFRRGRPGGRRDMFCRKHRGAPLRDSR